MKKFTLDMQTLIMNHYSLFTFIVKSAVLSFCIEMILTHHCPKYHFPDPGKRCNLITGKCETYSNANYNKGWKE